MPPVMKQAEASRRSRTPHCMAVTIDCSEGATDRSTRLRFGEDTTEVSAGHFGTRDATSGFRVVAPLLEGALRPDTRSGVRHAPVEHRAFNLVFQTA